MFSNQSFQDPDHLKQHYYNKLYGTNKIGGGTNSSSQAQLDSVDLLKLPSIYEHANQSQGLVSQGKRVFSPGDPNQSFRYGKMTARNTVRKSN
jgi:hypothetical protein